MNTLQQTIKISVLFSLIAAGAMLAGCASRSSKTTSTADANSTVAAAATTAQNTANTAQADYNAAANTANTAANNAANTAASTSAAMGSQITNGVDGQAPITYDALTALQKLGALVAPQGQ